MKNASTLRFALLVPAMALFGSLLIQPRPSQAAPPLPPSVKASQAAAEELAALDARLAKKDWEGARSSAQALFERSRFEPFGPRSGALARLAVAEAGLGREAEAFDHWEMAQAIGFGELPEELLAKTGAPAEKLKQRRARSFGEVPAGVDAGPAGERFVPARRLEGAVPEGEGGCKGVHGPLWARFEGVIDAEGRLREPVVEGPDACYRLVVLEAARSWKFEPARRDGQPVAALYGAAINPPANRSFAEVVPKAPGIDEIVDFLSRGELRMAGPRIQGAWWDQLELGAPSRGHAAALLALQALLLASVTQQDRKSEAICLWQAAQSVAPALYHLDLSPFGEAGKLLDQNRFGAERGKSRSAARFSDTKDEKVQKPELVRESQVKPYTGRALRAAGKTVQVVVESIIDDQGALRDPVLLGPEKDFLGFDLATLEAACAWRFKPARRGGQPVSTYYVLTTNFRVDPSWGR